MSTPTGGPSNPIDPFALTKPHERVGTQEHTAERDRERIRSAYAPKKSRVPPAQGADVASHDPELDSSLEPARPHDQHYKQPASARRDADISDLRRLEATLRWIQREEAGVHIPRAAQLPPVPGLARADIGGRVHGDESSEFRLPRSLEPERMAPPPSRSRRDWLRASLILVIASTLAAPVAYYL